MFMAAFCILCFIVETVLTVSKESFPPISLFYRQ